MSPMVYQLQAYQSAPDNAPPSGKRSAEGGAGAGALLALPDGKHGENTGITSTTGRGSEHGTQTTGPRA